MRGSTSQAQAGRQDGAQGHSQGHSQGCMEAQDGSGPPAPPHSTGQNDDGSSIDDGRAAQHLHLNTAAQAEHSKASESILPQPAHHSEEGDIPGSRTTMAQPTCSISSSSGSRAARCASSACSACSAASAAPFSCASASADCSAAACWPATSSCLAATPASATSRASTPACASRSWFRWAWQEVSCSWLLCGGGSREQGWQVSGAGGGRRAAPLGAEGRLGRQTTTQRELDSLSGQPDVANTCCWPLMHLHI